MAETENEELQEQAGADAIAQTPETPQDETAHDALPETPIEGIQSENVEADSDADTADADNASDDNANDDAVSEETASNVPVLTTSRDFAAQGELVDALASSGEEEGAEERQVENGRNYEMVYISRVGDGEATENTAKSLRALIEGADGAIDHVRTSETRRLAYPIGGEIEGVYVVVNGRFAPTHIGEVDRFFKLQENVIRHMILRQDD